MNRLTRFVAMLAVALPTNALVDDDEFGLAGLLSARNKEDLPPITLSAGVSLA